MVPLEEWLDRFPSVVIHGNANDRETTPLVLPLKLHVPGNFSLAPVAPGGPKIKQDSSAFVVTQRDGVTVRVVRVEVGGCLP
jgi:hypothetical protein